ncbi:helix-turn-helix transcriptional regulator [Enterococcus thailandicus]|uniref:helix-turn-helix transcriptional regulator n=1 Tax=Enterococcus thailandicus TaxID=417368 RepID=UPI00288D58C4|nr:DNA-binding response regulator [Enterococcus thailandicus]MDT2751905.1 DNA-binding response regulator [Enterococcus thailandicus]MDT2776046.1 DNA-binding response regulator [Enterococcus thailandicus]
MKTEFAGITSYFQNEVKKYRVDLVVNRKHYQKRGFTTLESARKYRNELEEQYKKTIQVNADVIVHTYLNSSSIRETAIHHNMSRQKVRKILITEGVYSTPQSIRVNELLASGYTTQEVADKLSVTVGTVNNLSAYRKGEYGVSKN